ncbi:MAG: T9SS type A sorting domain-containing protein [Saprospiraceae bacterium]
MKIPFSIVKIAISILVVVLGLCKLRAQQFDWLSDDFPGSRFMDIFEIDGKYYGAVSNGAQYYYDSTTIYQLSIYEIEFIQKGEPGLFLKEVITIPYPENFATSGIYYIEENKRWILIQSAVISAGHQTYRVNVYDELFNLISSTSRDTLGYPDPCHIDIYNGKVFILGSIQQPPRDELVYLNYSYLKPEVPSLEIKQSEPRTMFYVTDMKIDQRTGDMLVFYYSGIAVLDSTLHQKKRLGYNQIKTSDIGHVLGANDNYYSHGATSQGLGNGLRFLVFQKYDTLFNILFADTFGIKDQDNVPFLTRSIDQRDGNFLVGGHLDGPFNSIDFYTHIKKFYMAKYDSEMNRLWYKEYGGDRAYVMFGLKLLADGTSLAFGTLYDTFTYLRYAYIMHVDQNGEILTSTTMPGQPKTSIRIVNPGDEILRILNPNHIEGRIELYDIQGCHMLTGEINSDVSEINTQDLPAGLYPYVLMKDGRFIGAGKWVKAK